MRVFIKLKLINKTRLVNRYFYNTLSLTKIAGLTLFFLLGIGGGAYWAIARLLFVPNWQVTLPVVALFGLQIDFSSISYVELIGIIKHVTIMKNNVRRVAS